MLDLRRLRLLEEFAARGSIAATGAVGVRGAGHDPEPGRPGIGIAIVPSLVLAAGERRVAVRGLADAGPRREIYAVARTASVRRPSVSAVLGALRSAATSLPAVSGLPAGPGAPDGPGTSAGPGAPDGPGTPDGPGPSGRAGA